MEVKQGVLVAKQVFSLFKEGNFEEIKHLRRNFSPSHESQKLSCPKDKNQRWKTLFQPHRFHQIQATKIAKEVLFLFTHEKFEEMEELRKILENCKTLNETIHSSLCSSPQKTSSAMPIPENQNIFLRNQDQTSSFISPKIITKGGQKLSFHWKDKRRLFKPEPRNP